MRERKTWKNTSHPCLSQGARLQLLECRVSMQVVHNRPQAGFRPLALAVLTLQRPPETSRKASALVAQITRML